MLKVCQGHSPVPGLNLPLHSTFHLSGKHYSIDSLDNTSGSFCEPQASECRVLTQAYSRGECEHKAPKLSLLQIPVHILVQVLPPEATPSQQQPPPSPAPAPTQPKEAAEKPAVTKKLPFEDPVENLGKGGPETAKVEGGKRSEKGEVAKEAPQPAEVVNGGGGVGSKAEDQLFANSAGSAASRHGGSVYDIIVQVSSCLVPLEHSCWLL